MTDEQSKLLPGSDEAIEAGCTCPRIDNHYGEGAYTDEDGTRRYWYNDCCPIHGRGAQMVWIEQALATIQATP